MAFFCFPRARVTFFRRRNAYQVSASSSETEDQGDMRSRSNVCFTMQRTEASQLHYIDTK